jgi:uncharacterized protein (TIGR02996 family)
MNYKSLSKVLRYAGPTTEEDFHKILDAAHDDHTTRMVFADWLEEQGDPRAEGYRALGKLQIQPHKTDWTGMETHPQRNSNIYVYGTGGAMIDAQHKLPDDWAALIPYKISENDPDYHGRIAHWRENYLTRKEAEDAAALAFAQLPPERKEELLK